MSIHTLPADARHNVALFLNGPIDGFKGTVSHAMMLDPGNEDTSASEVPVLRLTDVPVFRSGTFRDSMGIQHTWEPLHLDQMVVHFDLLRNRGILPNVPVRCGHPSFFGDDPVDGLVGWHESLRTEERVNPIDQQTYTYLLATYVLLDEEAIKKYNAGLFLNRSAEVGTYITNSEAEFWPVYLGFAYVDIPAVEGLNTFAKDKGLGTRFSIMDQKEAPVTTGPSTTPTTPPAPPAAPPATQPAATAQTPPAAPVEPPAAPAAAATPATHAAQTNVATFRIGGQSTSDFAAVQAHIDGLELAAREQVKAARDNFVSELARQNKITAPQVPGLQAFAQTLNHEQYTAWQTSFDVAPAAPLLASHGRGGVGTAPAGLNEQTATDKRIEILEGVVKHHRQSGVTEQALKEMDSYKELQTLHAQRTSAQ